MALKAIQERRTSDRESRTFQYAGIDVMTTGGKVTLTREMASTLKDSINNGGSIGPEQQE